VRPRLRPARRLLAYLAWYVRLPRLRTRLRLRTAALDSPSHHFVSNPSVTNHAGRIVVALRELEGRLDRGRGHVVAEHSRTWIGTLDPVSLAVRELAPVDTDVFIGVGDMGLEDARVLGIADDLWCVWANSTKLPTQGYHTRIAAARRHPNGAWSALRTFESPRGVAQEKNWSPYSEGGELHVVYDFGTLTRFSLSGEAPLRFDPGAKIIPELRGHSGSSQLIPFDDGWLCITHRHTRRPTWLPWGDHRIYAHYFVHIGADWRLRAISSPFCFETAGGEFCGGMAVVGDDLVVSYGMNDQGARVMRIPQDSVRSLLRAVAG